MSQSGTSIVPGPLRLDGLPLEIRHLILDKLDECDIRIPGEGAIPFEHIDIQRAFAYLPRLSRSWHDLTRSHLKSAATRLSIGPTNMAIVYDQDAFHRQLMMPQSTEPITTNDTRLSRPTDPKRQTVRFCGDFSHLTHIYLVGCQPTYPQPEEAVILPSSKTVSAASMYGWLTLHDSLYAQDVSLAPLGTMLRANTANMISIVTMPDAKVVLSDARADMLSKKYSKAPAMNYNLSSALLEIVSAFKRHRGPRSSRHEGGILCQHQGAMSEVGLPRKIAGPSADYSIHFDKGEVRRTNFSLLEEGDTQPLGVVFRDAEWYWTKRQVPAGDTSREPFETSHYVGHSLGDYIPSLQPGLQEPRTLMINVQPTFPPDFIDIADWESDVMLYLPSTQRDATQGGRYCLNVKQIGDERESVNGVPLSNFCRGCGWGRGSGPSVSADECLNEWVKSE